MTKRILITFTLLMSLTSSLLAQESSDQIKRPKAAQGVMLGELTNTSVLAQIRVTATRKEVDRDVPGSVGFVRLLCVEDGQDIGMIPINAIANDGVMFASPIRDYIVRANFQGLKPDTNYTCLTWIGSDKKKLKRGPSATFKTHPGKHNEGDISFVVVTGMNYAKFHGDNRIDKKIHLEHNNTALPKPYRGLDKHLGYPALASILKLKPNFFVGTGDNVYYDTPKEPRAETIEEMRQKWHEQFVQPRYLDLFSQVPTYWEVDDHDYRIDDGDNTGDHKPSPAEAVRIMLEQLPYAPAENDSTAKTYRTHRISKDLQVWFVEGRIYRSPNAMEESSEKTIWGVEQKVWLKNTLKESDATFKVLISPTPMIGPDDARKFDNHTNFGGFRNEREEFFSFVKESGLQNFYLVCGDRHWQYHAKDPSGIEEFSSGALIDANSRPGRKPGDSESTDPDAKIKHLYNQDPPSGGFLHIRSKPSTAANPASLEFTHHNEKG
ncbi:MAG: alkaline phosphatase D family protein, partial [Pirellulaceae bacterium]